MRKVGSRVVAGLLALGAALVFGWIVGAMVDLALAAMGIFIAGSPLWFLFLLIIDFTFGLWLYRRLTGEESHYETLKVPSRPCPVCAVRTQSDELRCRNCDSNLLASRQEVPVRKVLPGQLALTSDSLARLERLAALKQRGALTEEEFKAQKAKLF